MYWITFLVHICQKSVHLQISRYIIKKEKRSSKFDYTYSANKSQNNVSQEFALVFRGTQSISVIKERKTSSSELFRTHHFAGIQKIDVRI